MSIGIGVTTPLNSSPSRAARLREALAGYGAFFAAARHDDPLPLLRDLACDWLRVEDLRIDVPAGMRSLHTDEPHRLCGPVLIGRRVIGCIEAQRSNVPFDEDDRALLAALGQIIGAALEYSSLQSQLTTWADDRRTHDDTLDHLLAFGRAVVRGPSEPLALGRQIATQVPGMLGGERASVLLLPIEGLDEPLLILSSGATTSAERAREVAAHGLAGLVLRERVPMIIDETDTDQRWVGLGLGQNDTRTRCAMAAPLLWGQHAIGALTITTTQSRLFNPTQLNLLELIACHTSLAIHAATFDARLLATTTTLGAMATYLDAALLALRQGNQTALETVAAVAERLHAEHLALSTTHKPIV